MERRSIRRRNGQQVHSLTAREYSAVVPILRTDTEGNEAQIFAIGANALTSASRTASAFMVDYGYSTLDRRDDIDYESYAGTGRCSFGRTRHAELHLPVRTAEYSIDGLLDYTDPSNVLLTDPGGWGQVGFLSSSRSLMTSCSQLRAEATYEFGGGLARQHLMSVGCTLTVRRTSIPTNPSCVRPLRRLRDGALADPDIGLHHRHQRTQAIWDKNILAYDPSTFPD